MRSFVNVYICLISGVNPSLSSGPEGPEARVLAPAPCELLHPHRLGAEEQPHREPEGPADLQLHQVSVDRLLTSPAAHVTLMICIAPPQGALPLLPDRSGRLEEHHPTQPVLQQQLPEDLQPAVPRRQEEVVLLAPDAGRPPAAPGRGAHAGRRGVRAPGAQHGPAR